LAFSSEAFIASIVRFFRTVGGYFRLFVARRMVVFPTATGSLVDRLEKRLPVDTAITIEAFSQTRLMFALSESFRVMPVVHNRFRRRPMNTPLENEVARRFGVLPNFFRLASSDSTIAVNLWGFAQFAYLDNPLPSLFKERLFVYLSRFCEVRYCIARHVGFLVGLGYPAGDSGCTPQKVESILPLLRRPLPRGDGLLPIFAVCNQFDSPLSSFPEPDSVGE
jgi:hypothetical protein